MVKSLEKEFEKLELLLDELFLIVQPLSNEQQNFKPDVNSWSMLQVFRHLIQSETQINKYLRKKILGADAVGKAGVGAFFRSLILNTALRIPIKYRVPDSIQVKLEEEYVYNELVAEWRSLRRELRDFLENIDESTSRKEIFRHPVVGRMSILQGLSFMQEHVERHTEQVQRIMNNSQFPNSISAK